MALDEGKSVAEAREARVAALLAQMSLGDKVGQMTCHTPWYWQALMLARYNLVTFDSGRNRRLGIPAVRFTDGPRGIVMGHSTCFPVSMARGATWDPALEERVGSAMGIEARAQGANYFGGVCINLLRHPGWGRAQETFGEDPHLLGAMGVAMVCGLQRHVMACAKHFACNSIENSRFFVNVVADERALREVYLPHFQKCVEAGVASIMTAYNRVNGRYCGHNPHLLRDVLKGDWGFDGFTISDFFFGVRDTVPAASAGLDIEYPIARFYGRRLKRAVQRGDVSLARIDDAVTRILRQKDRFAGVGEPDAYGRERVACPAHAALAREVAEKSMVLLSNRDRILPLDPDRVKSIAVIGRLADRVNLGDVGSSRVRPPYVVTPLAGIQARAGSLRVIRPEGRGLKAARAAARSADAAVVVVGLTWRDEGENIVPFIAGDRLDLRLSQRDQRLILAAAEENPRVIVVVEGGSAVCMEEWRDRVAAILMAWYPGMEGGNALARVLFGDVNPSGKLPLTIPRGPAQLPPFDPKAREVEYGLFHGYRLIDRLGQEPAFAFGFGQSYTTYAYTNLRLDRTEVGPEGVVAASVDVTNTGDRAGEEVVQLYVAGESSKVERAPKELKGFARVALAPGETRTVALTLAVRDLRYWDVTKNGWEIEATTYKVMVGPSSRAEDLRLGSRFEVVP